MSTLPDIARWQRVKHILGEALELPAGERQAFLLSQAADTAELRHLQALQAAGNGGHALLDGGREALFAHANGSALASGVLPDLGGPPDPAWPGAARPANAGPDELSADWSGRVIGPYRLLALIARGGMGQVYRAEPLGAAAGPGRPDGAAQMPPVVAVKLVREGWIGSVLQPRFQAERRILERLAHPNLARLLDGGIHANMPYLVMELVDGEPIDAYCRRHALDVPAVLRLFLMLCDVVHYAHGQGVVHRDLKPANVLVTREGQVKLLDFGIAKQLAGFTAAGESTATVTALRVMTLACASPEQVRGLPVTPASDVYSLGVLLYRLLTGRLPYRFDGQDRAGNDLDLRNAICHAPPLRPSQALPDQPARQRALRGDLDAAVLKALRKQPERRHASAAAFADELRRHLESGAVRARRPGTGGFAALLRRPNAGRASMLAAGLLLAAGAAVGWQAWQQARAEAAWAEREWAGVQAWLHAAAEVQRSATDVAALAPGRQQLQQARQALERLQARAGGDAESIARLAQAFGRIGVAQAGRDGLGLDDPAVAERSLRRALALFGPAVVATADAQRIALLRREWAAAQIALAGLLPLQGRSAEAQALAREARANAEQAASVAGVSGADRLQALADLALAQALDPVRHGEELQARLRSASGRLDALRREHPGDADLLQALAAVFRQQGQSLLRADPGPAPGTGQAAQAFSQAVALLAPAADGPATRPDTQLALALARDGLAQALQQERPTLPGSDGGGDGGALALASATRARDAVQALWRAAPRQRALQWHLADVSATLGRLQLAAGALDAAVKTASDALAAVQAPDDQPADDRPSRYRQGWAWYQLGQALTAQASAAEAAGRAATDGAPPPEWLRACDSYRRSLGLLEPLRSGPPGQAWAPEPARLIEMRLVLRTCPSP